MAMYGLFYGPWTCLHIALVITILVTPVTWTVILKEGKEETGSMGMDTPPPNKLDTALHIDQIIPDLLDRAPNYTAQIQWIGGARARLGNFISPSNITELPHLVAWHGNGSLTKDERNHYFTLLLTGPDHPSRDNPYQREFLYWHLVNIQGYTQEKRDTLVDYLGPNPASKTDYGTILKPEMAKFAPYLIKWPVKNDTFYTVIMIGLDEPSRESPSLREWLHYLVVNIPGPTVFQGEILARWVQPLPEMGSGYHRYVFLIYQQKARTAFSERRLSDIRSDKDRAHFSHQRFADKYEMGIPLAVNFFQCTGPFNASVPTVSSAEIEVPDFNFYDVAKVEEKTKKEAEMNKEKEDKRNQEIPEHFSLVPPE